MKPISSITQTWRYWVEFRH